MSVETDPLRSLRNIPPSQFDRKHKELESPRLKLPSVPLPYHQSPHLRSKSPRVPPKHISLPSPQVPPKDFPTVQQRDSPLQPHEPGFHNADPHPLPTFQRLSLSIPIESKNYVFMSEFLARVCNVDASEALAPKTPTVLPNISFPADFWLKDDLSIKDTKIKTTMLQEINTLIERELTSTTSIDETTLVYYEKLLCAYKFYDIPIRNAPSYTYTPPDLLLREEEEETMNEDDAYDKLERKSSTDSLSASQRTYNSQNSPSFFGSNNNSNYTLSVPKRTSGLSTRKRFLLLGHNDNDSGPNEDEHKKQQVLNALLLKSKLYNKIKKNRELSSSLASNTSGSSYSNRNSVSTSTTASSSNSRRRVSFNYYVGAPDINESRLLAVQQSPVPSFLLLTQEQRVENKAHKHEYYVQLVRLQELTNRLIGDIAKVNNISANAKLMRFIDFIRKKVLRFVLIDVSQMLMDYGQLKTLDLRQ